MNGLAKNAVSLVKVDEEDAGQRLDNFLLARLKGVPKSHVYKLVRGGQVRVNGGRADVSRRLLIGDEVRVPPVRVAHKAAAVPALLPGAARLAAHVLFRDEFLLVLNKPAGWAVHGGSGIARGVIEQLRLENPQTRFMELAHRLDRETSGLLLVALKRRALLGLHEALREGRTDKRYLALAAGAWMGETRHARFPLHKYLTAEGERRVRVEAGGQAAHTVFTRRKSWPGYSLLEAQLKTGRTHQIRVHLAEFGCPIAGDDKYGDFALNKALAKQGLKRMFLHAWRLSLKHPVTGQALELEAPLPAELQNFIDHLDRHAATL